MVNKSPDSIILDEPQRFSERLVFNKIEKAKNPQKEFLKQMEKKWNQKAGLYLWNHFVEKYDLINAVYKAKYKEDLNKDLAESYFKKFKEKEKNYQKRIESRRIKLRATGKKIKPNKYSEGQILFIKRKKEMPLYMLATEFNRYFKTKLSRNAIRDKRLRILNRKK